MDKSQPSYYAVIPASIRYDKKLPQGAKLLFGEISALSNKEGYCWAGNAYFAELYQASERTIINWINALSSGGHISVSFTYVPGKKEVNCRHLRILVDNIPNIIPNNETSDNESTGGEKIFTTCDLNSQEVVKIETPKNPEVVKNSSPRSEKNFTTYGKIFQEVVKNSSGGGENNFMDNNKNNNKNNTAAADPDFPEGEPLPTVEKVVAAGFTPQDIKAALSALDGTLLLSDDFYPRASVFMCSNNLDEGYFDLVYRECELRKPDNFKAYYYRLFFKDNIAELYKVLKARESANPEPALPEPACFCPACGHELSSGGSETECPNCTLPDPLCATPDKIALYREIYSMPPDKRFEYFKKEKVFFHDFKNDKDFKKLNNRKTALKKEFGISVSS